MKINQLSFAILAVILVISSCKKPPEASFTHSSDSYEEGDGDRRLPDCWRHRRDGEGSAGRDRQESESERED